MAAASTTVDVDVVVVVGTIQCNVPIVVDVVVMIEVEASVALVMWCVVVVKADECALVGVVVVESTEVPTAVRNVSSITTDGRLIVSGMSLSVMATQRGDQGQPRHASAKEPALSHNAPKAATLLMPQVRRNGV